MSPRIPSPRPTKWPGAWSSKALVESIDADQLPLFDLTVNEKQATARHLLDLAQRREELSVRLSTPRRLRPLQPEPRWRGDRND
jgi:hypothetical protein